jgi:hypothetical protein
MHNSRCVRIGIVGSDDEVDVLQPCKFAGHMAKTGNSVDN